MNGTTISGIHFAPVTLSNIALQNPATVAIDATVAASGIALTGLSGFAWTLINNGSITGTGDPGTGVYLASGGTLFNRSTGTITGTTHGVAFAGYGTIVNQGHIWGGASATNPGAIYLLGGGYVTNQSDAVISAASSGILGLGANADTVANQGTIIATGNGIFIDTGGSVTNQSGGTIQAGGNGITLRVAPGYTGAVTNQSGGTILAGTDGIYVYGATAINQGYISASSDGMLLIDGSAGGNETGGTIIAGSIGVDLDGGAFTNQSGATISAGTGIRINPGSGTVVNQGLLAGSLYGVYLTGGGAVTNLSGGLISGAAGVRVNGAAAVTNTAGGTISGSTIGVIAIGGAATLLNAGTIAGSGTAGYAVTLGAGYADWLTVDPGAAFIGTVSGGNTVGATAAGTGAPVASTLELASGAASGTLSGLGSQFVDFSQVQVDAGALWTLTGAASIAAGQTLTDNGTLLVAGTLGNAGTIAGNGVAAVRGEAGATVVNAGLIDPANYGISLPGGGSVTNVSGGTITGSVAGVKDSGAPGTVSNAGRIDATGAGGAGVQLNDGGLLANLSGGIIDGTVYGVQISSAATLTNSGRIGVVASVGIGLPSGLVTNAATATIAGTNAGIRIGHGTVVNAGTISGGGDAVHFYSGSANLLVVDPGAVFVGTVEGGNTLGATAVSTLELASGASAGTLSGLGTTILDFADLTIDSGAAWTLGSSSLAAGYAITDLGTLINAGTLGAPVTLGAGAYFSNASGGTIIGSGTAAIRATGSATVVNAGLIDPAQYGVYLPGGGSVTNIGGTIAGIAAGVKISGAAGTVVNGSSLYATGTNSSGVELISGGWVTNQTGGIIDGTRYGVQSSNAATVTNSGLIGAGAAVGIGLSSGMVTNAATGTITGTGGGIHIFNGGTVVDAGTISGGGDAVHFYAGSAARLVVDPGAVFAGTVDGGNTIGATSVSTLELAGATPGTLSAIGTQFIDFVQTTIDAGAGWTLTGTNTFAAGSTLTNSGTLSVQDATLSSAGTVINDGTLQIDPSSVTLANLIGTGAATIGDGSTLDILGTVTAGETIAFTASTGLLTIGQTPFAAEIDNFVNGDTIDLTGVTDGETPVVVNSDTLQIARSGNPTINLTVNLGPAHENDAFAISATGAITDETPCFLRDTKIRTAAGEVMVQDLTVGERVLTLSGRSRPITWIGTGRVLVSPGRRCAATPIVVRKNALADGVPYYDLRITKGHSLFVDGVLVPVEFLVNHRSIHWDDHKREVEFYHIELEAHDVLIANGAPSESYRDDGNRWLFENANTGWGQAPKPPCAPVLTGGPVVDAIWRRLLDRAGPRPGVTLTEDRDLHLIIDGERLDPEWQRAGTYAFRLTARPSSVRIVSRAASPAELGLARDPRCLGVALTRITVGAGMRLRIMEAGEPTLTDGFHGFEPELGLRWTDGDAALPAALFEGFSGPLELLLQIGGSARYPLFCEANVAA